MVAALDLQAGDLIMGEAERSGVVIERRRARGPYVYVVIARPGGLAFEWAFSKQRKRLICVQRGGVANGEKDS